MVGPRLVSWSQESIHRMPRRCFPGYIPALLLGAASKENMRDIEPTELPQKWGFLDSGNGRAPQSLKVALSERTSLASKHIWTSIKVSHVRENTLHPKGGRGCSSLSNVCSVQTLEASAGSYLHLHLSWSNCGCNLS